MRLQRGDDTRRPGTHQRHLPRRPHHQGRLRRGRDPQHREVHPLGRERPRQGAERRHSNCDGELIDDLLAAADHIGALLDAVEQGGGAADEALAARGQAIADAAKAAHLGSLSRHAASRRARRARQPSDVRRSRKFGRRQRRRRYLAHLPALRPRRAEERHGPDGLPALPAVPRRDRPPHHPVRRHAGAADMDPESCYLGFEINFRSDADKAAIERRLRIRARRLRAAHPAAAQQARRLHRADRGAAGRDPAPRRNPGQVRRPHPGRTRRRPAPAAGRPRRCRGEGSVAAPSAASWSSSRSVQPELVEAAAAKQKQVGEKKAAEARLIRVQADKLDQLIDLVGELVIAGAGANLIAQKSGQTDAGRSHLGALAPGREHPRQRPAAAHGADRRHLQPLPARGARRLARERQGHRTGRSAAPTPNSTSPWWRRSATR